MDQIDWKKVGLILLFLLLLVASLSAVYLYIRYKKATEIIGSPPDLTKAQTENLVKQVGRLIELPDEEPTIASVLDKNKLSDQPFFKNAENGDRVLVFRNAKKAILYRPSENKIIEVAPVNIGTQSATTTQPLLNANLTPSPSPSPKPRSITPTPTPSP